jgi:hypothetical protein
VRREFDDLRDACQSEYGLQQTGKQDAYEHRDDDELLSLAIAGIARSVVVRLASSRASLTREVVTMNDDVANSADTQQETIAPAQPAVSPATA